MNIYKRKLKTKIKAINDPDAGFTLIEVVISALILMAFVAISAQSILLSSYVRIKAQERAKAHQAIQEDIELLRLVSSSNLAFNDNANTCSAGSFGTGYANSFQNYFIEAKKSYVSNYDANSFASENFSFVQTSSFSQNSFNHQIRLRRMVVSDATRDPRENYKVLRIRYRAETTKKPPVLPDLTAFNQTCDRSTNCVLEDYIEVIPNAALRCP